MSIDVSTERLPWGLALLGRYTPRNEIITELHAIGRGGVPYVVAFDGFTGQRAIHVDSDGKIEVIDDLDDRLDKTLREAGL